MRMHIYKVYDKWRHYPPRFSTSRDEIYDDFGWYEIPEDFRPYISKYGEVILIPPNSKSPWQFDECLCGDEHPTLRWYPTDGWEPMYRRLKKIEVVDERIEE